MYFPEDNETFRNKRCITNKHKRSTMYIYMTVQILECIVKSWEKHKESEYSKAVYFMKE